MQQPSAVPEGGGQGFGIAAVVLGSITFGVQMLGGLLCGWIGWPLGFIAILLGVVAITKGARGLGAAGIGLSVIGVILQVLALMGLLGAAASSR